MNEVVIGEKPWWNWKRTRLLKKIDDLLADIDHYEASACKKDALILAMDAERDKRQWVSVEDGLSEDKTTVSVMLDNGHQTCGFRERGDWYWHTEGSYWYGDEGAEVTHWMPLPAPPTEAAGE